jgi:fimbrial chaperone protein
MHGPMLRRLFLGLVLIVLSLGRGQAAVLEVAPVTIELSGGAETAAITLLSHDTAPVYVQVRGFVWTQSGNEDTLAPTDDIVLAPPLFSLPGSTRQVVRIVLQQPVQSQERCYRLLIDQIPSHADQSGVQFAIRLSLPIFVEPDQTIAPAIKTHIEDGPGGHPVLVVDNTGTRRTRLVDLALLGPDGRPLKLAAPANPYVLAGAERRWTIMSPASAIPQGAMLRITAKTDNGPFHAQVAFTS